MKAPRQKLAKPRQNRKRAPSRAKKADTPIAQAAAWRIWTLGIALAIGGIVVGGRAYQLQILEGHRYTKASRRQSVSSSRVTAKRGVIKDRHGAELALSVDVDSIFAEPRRIAEPEVVASQVAPLLGMKKKRVLKKLKSKAAFRYLKRRVPNDIADKIRALKIKGIGSRGEPKRFYSNRALAPHILGWTNFDGAGVAGIERTFDAVLRGRSYEVPGLRDALGKKVMSEGFVPQAVLEGDDVILTIDRHIQHAAQVELKRAVEDNGGVAGVAIVMSPKTGDILALASYPDFNPNNLRGSSSNNHLNRAISAVYEPGSTLKLVTISAGLEEGLIEGDSTIDCEMGKWKVGRRTIRDANHKYGVLSIGDVLKVSSNICSAKLGFKLGRERLYSWLHKFGMGKKIGIELPGEVRGLIRPYKKWRDIALANISFGQGLSVTPLQIVQAAGTVASGGLRVSPRIVRATVDKAGFVTEAERPDPVRVLKPKTVEQMTKMMIGVTQEGGTAPKAAIPGFSVAGKTGTSQKIDPVTRGYSHSLHVGSFVGFAPAEDPEVVAFVLVDEPKKSMYGGIVAAPAFRRIVTAALTALEVYPTDPAAREAFVRSAQNAADRYAKAQKPSDSVAVASPDAKSTEGPVGLESGLSDDARALLGEAAKVAQPTGRDLSARSPDAWETGAAAEPSPPDHTNRQEALRMPNFTGLGPREVVHRSAKVGCDLVLNGTGRAVGQSPRPGARLRRGARCEVTLSTNG